MIDPTTILLIEDEHHIREVVAAALEEEGYTVVKAETASQAAVDAATHRPDLVILDLGLPDRDGLDFIRDLRAWSQVPILILSARTQEKDKVAALDGGADDYVAKPFGLAELLARIRVLLRRPAAGELFQEPNIRFGDFEIDCVKRVVERCGRPMHLTQIEYRLLVFLAANPGRVLTHHLLLSQIWGRRAADNHQYLRVYVGHLRQKIEAVPASPRHILTEIGVGYRFEP